MLTTVSSNSTWPVTNRFGNLTGYCEITCPPFHCDAGLSDTFTIDRPGGCDCSAAPRQTQAPWLLMLLLAAVGVFFVRRLRRG